MLFLRLIFWYLMARFLHLTSWKKSPQLLVFPLYDQDLMHLLQLLLKLYLLYLRWEPCALLDFLLILLYEEFDQNLMKAFLSYPYPTLFFPQLQITETVYTSGHVKDPHHSRYISLPRWRRTTRTPDGKCPWCRYCFSLFQSRKLSFREAGVSREKIYSDAIIFSSRVSLASSKTRLCLQKWTETLWLEMGFFRPSKKYFKRLRYGYPERRLPPRRRSPSR